MCHFLWQAQHLVKFMCHFLWQAQHLVKCGMIAGPGNVVIFNRICFWRARKVTSAARRVAVCIRQPKHFVCIAVLHPTTQDLRCLAMHDFFSIGLLVSYRFMFFFIDWKLPPPACPGTTGIYCKTFNAPISCCFFSNFSTCLRCNALRCLEEMQRWDLQCDPISYSSAMVSGHRGCDRMGSRGSNPNQFYINF